MNAEYDACIEHLYDKVVRGGAWSEWMIKTFPQLTQEQPDPFLPLRSIEAFQFLYHLYDTDSWGEYAYLAQQDPVNGGMSFHWYQLKNPRYLAVQAIYGVLLSDQGYGVHASLYTVKTGKEAHQGITYEDQPYTRALWAEVDDLSKIEQFSALPEPNWWLQGRA